VNRLLTRTAAAVTGAILLSACGGGTDGPSEQGAAVMCEEFVKEKLKSPGTAEFSGVTETKIKTLSDKKPWKYQVTAWVDSQNDFGGVVRNPYMCVISTKDDHNWTLNNLQFTDPQ
jgi:hypothetical protein